jgi:hypothetical protein
LRDLGGTLGARRRAGDVLSLAVPHDAGDHQSADEADRECNHDARAPKVVAASCGAARSEVAPGRVARHDRLPFGAGGGRPVDQRGERIERRLRPSRRVMQGRGGHRVVCCRGQGRFKVEDRGIGCRDCLHVGLSGEIWSLAADFRQRADRGQQRLRLFAATLGGRAPAAAARGPPGSQVDRTLVDKQRARYWATRARRLLKLE